MCDTSHTFSANRMILVTIDRQLRAVCLKRKIQIWHSTHNRYKRCKFRSNRLIFKDILLEDQCTLSVVSMFPFEGFSTHIL